MSENIDDISLWVSQYFAGYVKYMTKHYPDIFNKFYQNIHPPQHIGGCVMIGQSARNSDEDYAEIMKISKEFCEKYAHPTSFPADF